MNLRQEKLFQRVQEAQKSALANRLYEREQAILARLVSAYRADKLSHEQLFGGIAAIAEIRSMLVSVDQDQMLAADFDPTSQPE